MKLKYINKDITSQECSNCGNQTGKKKLTQRVHHCQFCGYPSKEIWKRAKVINNRGLIAVVVCQF